MPKLKYSPPNEFDNFISQFNESEPAPETRSEYWARNAAQAAPNLYVGGRSGFGLGDLLQYLGNAKGNALGVNEQQFAEQHPNLNIGQNRPQDPFFKAGSAIRDVLLRAGLPTGEQATGEAKAIFPKYATQESREGDWPAQLLLQNLPFVLSGGGLKSAGQFGKNILHQAGILGGAEAASAIGEQIGSLLLDPNDPDYNKKKTLFGIASQFPGAWAGGKLANRIINAPSKVLPELERELLEQQFEASKQERLNEATEKLETGKKEAETKKTEALEKVEQERKEKSTSRATEEAEMFSKDATEYFLNLDEIENRYKEENKTAEKNTKSAKEELPVSKEVFTEEKNAKIRELSDEIEAVDTKAEAAKKESDKLYGEAEKIENEGSVDAHHVEEALKQVSEELQSGLPIETETIMHKIFNDVKNTIVNGKITIKQLKRLKRNINKNARRATKHLGPLFNALRETILENNSAEHNKLWQAAEKGNEIYFGEEGVARRERAKTLLEQDLAETKKSSYSPIEKEYHEQRISDTQKAQRELENAYKEQRTALEKRYKESTGQQKKKSAQEIKMLEKEYSEAKEKINTEYESTVKALEKQHADLVKAIGEESFEKLLGNKEAQSDYEKKMSKVADYLSKKLGSAGTAIIGSILGSFFGQSALFGKIAALGAELGSKVKSEYTMMNKLFEKHPVLRNQYMKILNKADADITNKATLNALVNITSKVKKLAQKEFGYENDDFEIPEIT